MRVFAAFPLVLCHLAISHAWTCNEVKQMHSPEQIDAGLGQVVATDKYNNAYILSGKSWYHLPSAELKHVSAGPAGIWGVDKSDNVLKLVAGVWKTVPGMALKQIDAGGNGNVVGVSGSNTLYCFKSTDVMGFDGVSSLPGTEIEGKKIKYSSCGPDGCWGIDEANDVYVMKTPSTCMYSRWIQATGKSLTKIEVGTDGSVFGLTPEGQVYEREGITSSLKQGASWSRVSMCLPVKHLTYDLGHLWVITKSGILMKCTKVV